jgi:hypothetical protein
MIRVTGLVFYLKNYNSIIENILQFHCKLNFKQSTIAFISYFASDFKNQVWPQKQLPFWSKMARRGEALRMRHLNLQFYHCLLQN